MPINAQEQAEEEMMLMGEVEDGSRRSSPSASPRVSIELAERKAATRRLPTRRIFTTNMLLVLLTTLLYELHLNSINVATSNMLVDPVASREAELSRVLPFRFGGGAGFRPKSLAWYSTIFGEDGPFLNSMLVKEVRSTYVTADYLRPSLYAGIVGIPMQIFIYPWLNQRFGLLKLWRLFYLGFPLLYLSCPYIAIMPSTTPPPGEKTGFGVWAFIVLIQTVTSLITSIVTPSQLLLANFSSPHPSALGRTHSITFFTSMAVRAASSAMAGNLYAYGSTHNLTGLVFWVSTAVSLVAIMLTIFVREGNGHEIELPGEGEDKISESIKI